MILLLLTQLPPKYYDLNQGDKADQFSAVAAVAENNPRYWETAGFVFCLASLFYVMVIVVIRDRIALAVRLPSFKI